MLIWQKCIFKNSFLKVKTNNKNPWVITFIADMQCFNPFAVQNFSVGTVMHTSGIFKITKFDKEIISFFSRIMKRGAQIEVMQKQFI